MDEFKTLERAGLTLESHRRLIGKLYEVDPPEDKPKGPPTKDPNAALPAEKKPPLPNRTAGKPDRTRKDAVSSSGKELQTQIQQMVAELKKKFGLPRDTGEKPPPPPPEEAPPAPPATGR